MNNIIECNIIKFDNGTYFAGVKGKCVRETKSFKDAKIINKKISDRDKAYLGNKKYKLLSVTMKLKIINEIVKINS